jgi:methylated-DNA-[protein]-cysteine S-methyltransferase
MDRRTPRQNFPPVFLDYPRQTVFYKRWGETILSPELFFRQMPVMQTYTSYYKSSLGILEIVGDADFILSLDFVEKEGSDTAEHAFCVQECVKQIDEYFKGKRKKFFLNLAPRGTEFQKAVWHQLEKIPFGKVASYGDIARAIGKPKACRAVGNANGKNPIAIIIPCHRIIGSDGSLTGYSSGLWRKEWLLKHEKGYSPDDITA